ncbi:response regulator transcription factor [Actinomadura logoneensis]|uniref:response regulator transcription factor n=1 Tax=Actinomadura logoneensis TaxID=2293572 RepID=UPI001F4137E5|nr:response regulator transcription factor [Actinomadura logoneensis]
MSTPTRPSSGGRPAAAAPEVTGRILVVDDDPTVAEVVARYLVRDGHDVACVADGHRALRHARENPPDLIVLDLMLPGMDGLEVCRRLRETTAVPIVMLTALGAEADRLVGLAMGADDYVTKPFSPRELALRVRSVLRRARGAVIPTAQARPLRDGDLKLDPNAHTATLAGTPLTLTAREYDLLAFLLRNPGRAFTREQLLDHVWGWSFGDSATVTVHVRRLREKLELDPAAPRRLVTVWGVGYRYDPSPTDTASEDAENTRTTHHEADATDSSDIAAKRAAPEARPTDSATGHEADAGVRAKSVEGRT